MHRRTRVVALAIVASVAVAACGGTTSTGGTTAKVSPPPNSDLLTAGTLTIGSDVSYPPQEFFDPPGSKTPAGFDIDLGKALADHMGLKFFAQNQGFDAIFDGLNTKKYDVIMSAVTVTDERKVKFDFVPYFSAGQRFVILGSSAHKPTTLADICGLNVAVEKSTAEEDAVKAANAAGGACVSKKIKLTSYDLDTEAVAQLVKGTVDVHFTDSPVAEYEIKKHSELALSGPVTAIAPEGIVVRKGDKAMLDAVTAAFKSVQDDGTYDTILKKWGLTTGDIRKA